MTNCRQAGCAELCEAAHRDEQDFRFAEAACGWRAALIKFPFALLGSAEGKQAYIGLLRRWERAQRLAAAPLGHA